MKKCFILIPIFALVFMLVGCAVESSDEILPICPLCDSEAQLVSSCPCCGVKLCDWCGQDVGWDFEWERTSYIEDGYEVGYDEGYADAHREWYSEGYSEGYGDGYDDGSIEGYGQGYADALRGYEYGFIPASDFVWVPEGSNVFHKLECDAVVGDCDNAYWYWIEEALVLGYQYCKDCIGK